MKLEKVEMNRFIKRLEREIVELKHELAQAANIFNDHKKEIAEARKVIGFYSKFGNIPSKAKKYLEENE